MVDFKALSVRLHRQNIVECLFVNKLYVRVLVICGTVRETERVMQDMFERLMTLIPDKDKDLEVIRSTAEIKYRHLRGDGQEIVSRIMFCSSLQELQVPSENGQPPTLDVRYTDGWVERLQGQVFDLAWVYSMNGIPNEAAGFIGRILVGGYNPLFLGQVMTTKEDGRNVVHKKQSRNY